MPGYEHSPPYESGHLQVDSIHAIHYEQYGNPDGKTALFHHGGPGSGTPSGTPGPVELFDPKIYRIVLYDQRGCGKSKPWAELKDNTSPHLIEDVEKLRKHLNISKWHVVVGSSWGSTMSLMYSQAHPEVIGSMIINGIFLGTKAEVAWMRPGVLGQGAGAIWPEAHEAFLNYLPEADRHDPNEAYYKLLTSDDEKTRIDAARAYNLWDMQMVTMIPGEDLFKKVNDVGWSITHALFEAHYFKYDSFLGEGQLTKKENIDRIRNIPTTIIQGRYDMCCPARYAWVLHKAFPEAELIWVPDAGHLPTEPSVAREMAKAVDKYSKL